MSRKQDIDWSEPGAVEAVQQAAKAIGLVDIRPSDWDNRKWIGTLPNGHTASMHFEPVPANNARIYPGWVALSDKDWSRIMSPHPDMVHPYLVMIARSPDDRWWWVHPYDEDKLRALMPHIHKVRSDYWRLPPSVAVGAAVCPQINLIQTTLALFDEPVVCDHRQYDITNMADAGEPDLWACSHCGAPFAPVAVG